MESEAQSYGVRNRGVMELLSYEVIELILKLHDFMTPRLYHDFSQSLIHNLPLAFDFCSIYDTNIKRTTIIIRFLTSSTSPASLTSFTYAASHKKTGRNSCLHS